MRTSITIGKRLSIAFGFILSGLAVVGAVSLYANSGTRKALHQTTSDSLPGIHEIGRLADTAGHIRVLTLMYAGPASAEQKSQFRSDVVSRERDFEEISERYEPTMTTEEDRQLFRPIAPGYQAYKEIVDRVLELADASRQQEAYDLYTNEGRPRVLKLVNAINAEIAFNKNNGDRNTQAATQALTAADRWTWTLMLVTLLAGGAGSRPRSC